MRLFFAVTIPQQNIERVEAAQSDLKSRIGEEGIRWARPDQYHYTLKFLGEQPFHRAEAAVEVADSIASVTAPFAVSLSGIGAFPNSQRPSTLWIGATEGADELAALACQLDDVLSRRGFPREKRPVKAHLTLARIKTYTGEAAAARILAAFPQADCGTFMVDRFVMMRSILKPGGSEYSTVREFTLTKITE